MLHQRKAFTLLELMVAFIVMTILSAIAVPSLINVVTSAQTAANNSTALDLAQEAYDTNMGSYPFAATSASEYASLAASDPAVTGVTSVTGGAEFTFASGDPVCVTTPASDPPSLFSCSGGGGSPTTTTTTVVLASAWQNAIEVPGSGALNGGDSAYIQAISCGSAGNCSAGGNFTDGSGNAQAMVVDETNWTWGTAIEVPGIESLNTGSYAWINSISCSSAGNCSAIGDYIDSSGNQLVFVVSETNGTWGTAIAPPGSVALLAGTNGTVVISCGSAGNCSAGGNYGVSNGNHGAFVLNETSGVWGTAIEVPGTAALNTGGQAAVFSISCATAGNCAAVGSYATNSYNPFVVDETNGTWGTAIEVSTPTESNPHGTQLTSVSCTSAGNCSASGFYEGSSGLSQPMVVDETNGTWGTAIEVPGIAALNVGGYANLSDGGISCSSSGNCTTGGAYIDGSGHTQAFVANETDGTWVKAIEVPGIATLNVGGTATPYAISCSSAGSCAVTGTYTDGSGILQAFVANETSGTWGTAIEIPGTGSLNAG